MKRKELLEAAEACVCRNREEEYGSPEDSFNAIAKMWSAYLSFPIEAYDVPAMMVLMKVARISSGVFHDDNWVDIAGYAACGSEIEEIKEKSEQEA